MSYEDFTIEKVSDDFGLNIEENVDLFADVQDWKEFDPFFLNYMKNNIPLAGAIGTEKAKSEMIITPILIELRRICNQEISLFSGVKFGVDPSKGLNGFCDFLISGDRHQSYIKYPVMTIIEAKNENLKNGLGQCMAEMVAARIFNERTSNDFQNIYGAVTSGNQWKFLKLDDEANAYIDIEDYYIVNLGKIMGILLSAVAPKKINNNLVSDRGRQDER